MKTSERLIRAKSLISDPKHWTKGEHMTIINEKEQEFAYCALGAMRASADYHVENWVHQVDAFKAANNLGHDVIPRWNDDATRTHAEVMAAMDKAIAYAQVQEEKPEPMSFLIILDDVFSQYDYV